MKEVGQFEMALPCGEDEGGNAPRGAVAFRIGWDHAHHGLVPPPGLLLDGTPVGDGWRAGRAVFGSPGGPRPRARPWPAGRHVRRWLALRLQAWREGAVFDLATVTPNHLAQIEVPACPVRRVRLGGVGSEGGAVRAGRADDGDVADRGTDGAAEIGAQVGTEVGVAGRAAAAPHPDALVIARLNPNAAYAAGNLATMSHAAAQAWQGLDCAALVRRARQAEAAELSEAAESAVAITLETAVDPMQEAPEAGSEGPLGRRFAGRCRPAASPTGRSSATAPQHVERTGLPHERWRSSI